MRKRFDKMRGHHGKRPDNFLLRSWQVLVFEKLQKLFHGTTPIGSIKRCRIDGRLVLLRPDGTGKRSLNNPRLATGPITAVRLRKVQPRDPMVCASSVFSFGGATTVVFTDRGACPVVTGLATLTLAGLPRVPGNQQCSPLWPACRPVQEGHDPGKACFTDCAEGKHCEAATAGLESRPAVANKITTVRVRSTYEIPLFISCLPLSVRVPSDVNKPASITR